LFLALPKSLVIKRLIRLKSGLQTSTFWWFHQPKHSYMYAYMSCQFTCQLQQLIWSNLRLGSKRNPDKSQRSVVQSILCPQR
jgi:hypothetical protein